jgi:hypothetical protein
MRCYTKKIPSEILLITLISCIPVLAHAKMGDEDNDLDDIITVSGYIDGAYSYMERDADFVSGVPYISNDSSTNGFAIHQLALVLAAKPKEGLGFQFMPILGQDAFNLAPKGLDPDIGVSNMGFTAINAFAQYAVNSLTLYAGLMEALAGYEPIYPTKNMNFSRSGISSIAVPDTVTGLRAAYVVNKTWQVEGGINDGWDTVSDTSRPKTVELSIDYTPSPILAFNVSGMSGTERAVLNSSTGPTGQRNIIDSFAVINVTQKLAFMGEYNYGMQTNAQLPDESFNQAHWQGFAGYIRYNFNDTWYTAVRGEIFDDYDGYLTGVAQVWKEATLTLGYFINKDFLIRAEARHDFSNTDSFVDIDSDALANNQQLFALEAYYIF